LSLFIGCFFVSGNAGAYWNMVAFIVVFSGTLGATFLSFSFSNIKRSLKSLRKVLFTPKRTTGELVDNLLELSVRSKCSGPSCFEQFEKESTDSYLQEMAGLLADNYKEEEIREILGTQMRFFKFRRGQDERILRHMATIAPAFGVAGSVIGLIGLLMGIGDTAQILKHIPIALVSTLYGIILGNFLFSPLAENIAQKTEEEILHQVLSLEGGVAMLHETHPYKIEKLLSSYLPPEERALRRERIREKRREYAGNSQAAA
jgi:chemotaxis protein MotA